MHFTKIISILVLLLLTSCRNELDFETNIGNLSFSKETVYLDTVFTNIGSSTYTLKVYNNTNKNISIPKVKLGKGQASKYRLMVDGLPGKEFENVEILAKDSMYVFIEVTADVADANPTDFLYTDEIQFGDNTNYQKVNLVTLIQDAIFIYPERTGSPNNYNYEEINLGVDGDGNPVNIVGTNLSHTDVTNGDELHWTNTKPYVIYGYAKIPDNEELIVDAGTRVHFHANSGLIVGNGSKLKVNGNLSTTEALENEVIFEGDRLEPSFSEVPGQWGTIWFLSGSTDSNINHLTIKNATVGILISGNDGTPISTIDIENTQIYNCSNVGLLARAANITGKNMVINNCGETAIACVYGGKYDFTHCTFANYWGSTNQTCLTLNDYLGQTNFNDLTQANFNNCVFYGAANLSIDLEKKGPNNLNFKFNNCLIKVIDNGNQLAGNSLYNFSDITKYSSCIIANSSTTNLPHFKNTDKNQFEIGVNSICRNIANLSFATFSDIKGISRSGSADIGAYEYVP